MTRPDVDYYYDTDLRYQHDAEFRHAVEATVAMARQVGFTPGELKQIAFKAALLVEQRYGVPQPFTLHPRGFNLPNTPEDDK